MAKNRWVVKEVGPLRRKMPIVSLALLAVTTFAVCFYALVRVP